MCLIVKTFVIEASNLRLPDDAHAPLVPAHFPPVVAHFPPVPAHCPTQTKVVVVKHWSVFVFDTSEVLVGCDRATAWSHLRRSWNTGLEQLPEHLPTASRRTDATPTKTNMH